MAYLHKALRGGQQRYYKVVALDAAGNASPDAGARHRRQAVHRVRGHVEWPRLRTRPAGAALAQLLR